MGSKGQNVPFSEYGHVAFQITWNHECSNMVANHLSADTPHGQNSTFLEHVHVAYQIIWNQECSNIQAHILSVHTLSIPGLGSNRQKAFFLKVVMLHIKLNGMEHRAPCKHISVLTYPVNLWVGLKGTETLNVVMLHIKLRGSID